MDDQTNGMEEHHGGVVALDRAQFVPERIWPFDPETQTYGSAVDRTADPRRWSELVATDVQLVTQWDDGDHEGPAPGRLPTSSAPLTRHQVRMSSADGGVTAFSIREDFEWLQPHCTECWRRLRLEAVRNSLRRSAKSARAFRALECAELTTTAADQTGR